MDAVAFPFFRQVTEIRQRATDLYDRLRNDKQIAESIALVASIVPAQQRDADLVQVISEPAKSGFTTVPSPARESNPRTALDATHGRSILEGELRLRAPSSSRG
jgi:hypothetical protein